MCLHCSHTSFNSNGSFHEQKKNISEKLDGLRFVKVSNIDFLFRLQFRNDHLVRMDGLCVIMLRFFFICLNKVCLNFITSVADKTDVKLLSVKYNVFKHHLSWWIYYADVIK